MLSKLATSLILVGGVTAGGYELIDHIKPLADETAAHTSVQRIANAAYMNYEFSGDWRESLTTVANEMRSTQHIEIDGYTVKWFYGDACYQAELPTPDTEVEVAPC